ncbi:MAG: hypothetical protein PVI30_05855 [Myxococcales bacterium]|jgi:hypothetical protein
MAPLRVAISSLLMLLSCAPLAGCDSDHTQHSRKMILESHGPRVARVVIDELARHQRGLRKAAGRIGAGFVKVEGEQQEKEMRKVLQILRSPKKGVQDLVISPMSFMAAVDREGIVIARDTQPDQMKGMDLAELFPVVKQALQGEEGYAVGEFPSTKEGGEPSVTVIMATPVRFGGEVVGALTLGIPLWRLQQFLSKQLQMEAAGGDQEGVVLWVYVYRGAQLHHHGTPRDLDEIVPGHATRQAGLKKSPGGFTGELNQFGYWYAYGVRPLRVLGDDVGVIILRMDPQ